MVPVSSPTGSRPKAESSRELAALSVATLAAQYASFLLASIFFLRLRRRFFAAMLLTSSVDDRVDPLTGEEVLLRVFDFGSVVEGRVHIPVTMCVRDALHGPGRRLAEGDGCRRALNGDDLEIFTGTLSGRCLFLSFGLLGLLLLLALLDPVLEHPEAEAGHGRRDPQKDDERADVDFDHGVTS